MCQATRSYQGRLASARRVSLGRGSGRVADGRFFIGRRLFGDPDLEQRAVGIAKPQPVRLEPDRWIEQVDAHVLQALAKPRQIVFEGAEGDEVELLAGPLHQRTPAVRMPLGVDVELASLLAHVEAKRPVELLFRRCVGNKEIEQVEGVHAKLSGTTVNGLGERTDLGHWALL